MSDRLARKGWYRLLDGYFGYNSISIALEEQEKNPPLLVHMGPLRSRECRLGCAMDPPYFRDI